MSGLLPTTTGIYGNQQWIKPHLPKLDTLPQYFRKHGYHAVGAGKIFHHTAGNNAPGQWNLYRRLVFTDDGWSRTSDLLYPYSPRKPLPKNFPFCGIKLYSREVDWGTLAKPEKEFDDAQTIDFGIEFLLGKQEKPFFLACGVFHPHLPWYVPPKYLDLHPLDSIVLPETPSNDLEDVPKPGRQLALSKSANLKKIRDRGKWKEAVRHSAEVLELDANRPRDKQEIIDKAMAIDTFETSIQPDQDCCQLFVPKHPAVKATLRGFGRPKAGSTWINWCA